jgi:hypothetical protein
VECLNVEHEEVLLMPRWVKAKRVTFKYGLGTEFIDVLKTLNKLGLDKTDPVNVKGVQVSPRDVVTTSLPDPAFLVVWQTAINQLSPWSCWRPAPGWVPAYSVRRHFDAVPFLDLLAGDYGSPWGLTELSEPSAGASM